MRWCIAAGINCFPDNSIPLEFNGISRYHFKVSQVSEEEFTVEEIKEAIRKMHGALAKRGELAEPVIETYSEIVDSCKINPSIIVSAASI